MKARTENFVERCVSGEASLDAIARELNSLGANDLAKHVYALYTEAFLIQAEIEHQRERVDSQPEGLSLKDLPPGKYSCNAEYDERGQVTRIFNVQPAKS